MMVLPYDFDILRPSVPGSLAAGVSSGCGSGKTNVASLHCIENVEASRNLARQLDVRYLVFAHGNEVRLVNQNVGRSAAPDIPRKP